MIGFLKLFCTLPTVALQGAPSDLRPSADPFGSMLLQKPAETSTGLSETQPFLGSGLINSCRFRCLSNAGKIREAEHMAPKTAANPMMEKMHKALAYQKAGEFAKAQKIYKLVLKKLPDNADANHLLGVTYRQLGDPETAIKYIEKAIKLSPGQGVFYSNLARAHSDIPASGPEAILENAEKALLLNPNIVEAHNLKAIALSKLNRNDEAEEIFKLLISKVPGYADANSNYGLLLRDQKRYAEAVDFFDRAVKLDPANPENYIQRARARLETEAFERSKAELEQALKLFNDNANLHHEMARLLYKTGDHVGALPFAQAAFKDNPEDPHRITTLGVISQSLGQFEEALGHFSKARRLIRSDDATIEWNMSLAYLGLGDLKNGWHWHHSRFSMRGNTVLKRQFKSPEWKGEDISSKTLLVWSDQGLGDALRNCTLLDEIVALAGRVILEPPLKLVPIIARNFPDIEVRPPSFNRISLAMTTEDFDMHICLTDLACHFRPTIEDFKRAKQPSMQADSKLKQGFRQRLKNPERLPVVGVAWRSGNLKEERARWYMNIMEMAPILRTPGAIFVNLQYSSIEREIDWVRKALKIDFINFDDVNLKDDIEAAAALTDCCDLVISSNTSVADIAGALGVKCWRFGPPSGVSLLGQDNPPWHPSIKYYKMKIDEPSSSIAYILQTDLAEWIANFDRALGTSFDPVLNRATSE